MPGRNPLRLLLASIRFANLPSVICNVWLGLALTAIFPKSTGISVQFALLLTLAGVLLYLGGNLLNDWHDRDWDALHRPERALPQGVFKPSLYLGLAILLLAAGSGCATLAHPRSGVVAGLIVACIVGYTRWHKRHPASILLMGLCRALLPGLALAVDLTETLRRDWYLGGWCLIPLLALLLYLSGLSLLARRETTDGESAGVNLPAVWVCLAGPLMLGLVLESRAWSVIGPALLPLALWAVWTALALTRFRRPAGRQVSALLAGLPLLDWIVLLPIGLSCLDLPQLQPLALVSLLLPPLAFLAALTLQRLAPAT